MPPPSVQSTTVAPLFGCPLPPHDFPIFSTFLLNAPNSCIQVDIYGFTQRSNHYFNKQMNSRRAFGDKHAWALERQCSNLLSNLPAVSSHG